MPVIHATFASRPRRGLWSFEVHFVDGSVLPITRQGRHQADAFDQLLDALENLPEVKRIDCCQLLPDAEVAEFDLQSCAMLAKIGGAA